MNAAAILPDYVHPSIDDSTWAGSPVSDVAGGNGVGSARRWITKHLFYDVLWCHSYDNFIHCKVNQGVTRSVLPLYRQILWGDVEKLLTLRAR